MDGSVQSYAVNARRRRGRTQALILSLHGAGVDGARAGAGVRPARRFDAIVCPTNRRPFGFDWEDWGRWDAQDVLQATWGDLLRDPSRVYLTGHSMGGHGAWQLGVLFPDRFAAIAPSAGWRSFATYGGAAPPVERRRGRDADAGREPQRHDGVRHEPREVRRLRPPRRRRRQRARSPRRARCASASQPLVPDLHAHEQPGAGHWWDASDEPGADCVDWAPLMALFGRRRLPAHHEVPDVEFTTPDPAVTRHCFWVEVHAQARSRVPSRVRIERVAGKRRFVGTTENVRALALDVEFLDGTGPIDRRPRRDRPSWRGADGRARGARRRARADVPARGAPRAPRRRLARRRGVDARRERRPRHGDLPGRVRPAVRARRRHAGHAGRGRVGGTQGPVRRRDVVLRGNGTTEIVDDVAWDPARFAGRNVILYGHAEMNAAWTAVVGDGPVTVTRGAVVDRRAHRSRARTSRRSSSGP